ncbi:MAG: HAMP domain-containing histidine kinase [Gammaproteobacteria bacterium]|nr:HAMP domain-containing histidine kinase [Gammaproteobacteria bacterium]
MKNRLLFLLFILIPICLLIWFAYRAQSNELLATQQQYQKLAHSQLKLIDEKVVHYFQQLESSLIADRQALEPSENKEPLRSTERLNTENYSNKIRQFLKYSPYILNVYIADKDQKTIYPSLTQTLSEREQLFLSTIQVIINDRSLFNARNETEGDNIQAKQEQGSQNRFTAVSKQISSKNYARRYQAETAVQMHGWIAWYQERNLHHLFWFKDAQQRLYLLSLDRIRILSELIALLPEGKPASESDNHSLQDTTIQLMDANNELIYQWGNYPVNDNRSIDIMLSYPLSSWKLSWYAKKLSPEGFQKKWSLVIIALLASFLMLVILFIIYREYHRELRQAQQRVNFVSQVSHELKTPLTNIRMYAELLESKIESIDLQEDSRAQEAKEFAETKSKSQHFLAVIINESLRLSRLIENVLSFSKVQKQSFKVNKTKGVIDDCIDNVLLSFAPIFEQKKLTIQFIKNAQKAVFFDAQLLEQILNNLLSNIDKYASQGGKVDIVSDQSADNMTIEIRDYGPGIASNEQQKIFNPFYRSSSKLTEGVSGTGIGLTISQQLAILHGGKLSYKNMPQGACFVIQLATQSTLSDNTFSNKKEENQ